MSVLKACLLEGVCVRSPNEYVSLYVILRNPSAWGKKAYSSECVWMSMCVILIS